MDKKEAGHTLKVTTIFGGAQIIVVIAGLAKSKVAALLIGPSGVGVSALYNNLLTLMTCIIGFGIGQSAIREIAKECNDIERQKLALVSKQIVIILGVIGCFLTIIFSSQISEFQFGSSDYTFGFCLVGFAVACNVIQSGTDACLKGFRRIKQIALSSLLNSVGSVLITSLLYYFGGAEAIPYSILLCSVYVLVISWYFSRDIGVLSFNRFSFGEIWKIAFPMLTLGIMFVISNFIENFVSNIINIFIRIKESIVSVGIYQSANMISAMSIHMVYVAIASDYYPKLSESISNVKKMNSAINSQMYIALLLMAPIIAFMIVFSDLLIRVFLSVQFLSITDFIHWILLASFFHSFSWCLYFVPLAYGHSKRFFNMSVANVLSMLIIQIPCFWLGGLKWLAIGCILSKLLFCLIIYIYTYKRYGVRIKSEIFVLFVVFVSLFALLMLLKLQSFPLWTLIACLLCISVFAAFKIEESTDVFSMVLKKMLNKKE